VLSSFKTTKEILASPFSLPENWSFDNYVHAWTDAGIRSFFLNTVVVVVAALVLVMLLGAMCAYVLARFKFPGARFIYYLMLAGLTFPVFLAIVPLFFILKNAGLLNTLPGLIMVYVVRAAVHRVLPLRVLQVAAGRGLRGGPHGRRGGLASVLPDHAADGAARHGQRRHLQLPRPVEPVPAAGGPEHRPEEIRADPGDGGVRLPGRLRGRLRRALRRGRDHGRAGADRVPDLPARLEGSVSQGTFR